MDFMKRIGLHTLGVLFGVPLGIAVIIASRMGYFAAWVAYSASEGWREGLRDAAGNIKVWENTDAS